MSEAPEGQFGSSHSTKVPEASGVLPAEIRQGIQEILHGAGANLEPQQREQILAVISGRSLSYLRRGPRPHPGELAEYEKVLPGSAERIFAASERQSAHRISMEARMITAQIDESKRGQHYGLAIAILCLVFAFVAIMAGHEAAGSIIGSLDLVALVTVFVLGKRTQLSDLKRKAKAVPPPENA